MFTRDGGDLAFDSVRVVEGKFFIDPSTSTIEASVKMAYVDRETGTTYGKCVAQASLFSKETVEAFRVFLENVEQDYGSVVFKEGGRSTPLGSPGLGAAESTEPIKPKVLGGL